MLLDGVNTENIRNVKVCMLGDSSVGKSSLCFRFVEDRFHSNISTTFGASYSSRIFSLDGIEKVKYHLWDTAGQERFRSLTPLYYRNCDVAILVYDITSKISFHSLKDWVDQLHQFGPPCIIVVIVGNKVDKKQDRVVKTKNSKEYAESVDAIYVEVSAKTGENIETLFEKVTKELPPEEFNETLRKSSIHRETTPKNSNNCKC